MHFCSGVQQMCAQNSGRCPNNVRLLHHELGKGKFADKAFQIPQRLLMSSLSMTLPLNHAYWTL